MTSYRVERRKYATYCNTCAVAYLSGAIMFYDSGGDEWKSLVLAAVVMLLVGFYFRRKSLER